MLFRGVNFKIPYGSKAELMASARGKRRLVISLIYIVIALSAMLTGAAFIYFKFFRVEVRIEFKNAIDEFTSTTGAENKIIIVQLSRDSFLYEVCGFSMLVDPNLFSGDEAELIPWLDVIVITGSDNYDSDLLIQIAKKYSCPILTTEAVSLTLPDSLKELVVTVEDNKTYRFGLAQVESFINPAAQSTAAYLIKVGKVSLFYGESTDVEEFISKAGSCDVAVFTPTHTEVLVQALNWLNNPEKVILAPRAPGDKGFAENVAKQLSEMGFEAFTTQLYVVITIEV